MVSTILTFSGCHPQCCHQTFTSDLMSRITFAGKVATKIKNWPWGNQNLLSWAKEYIQKGRGKECRGWKVLHWLEIVEIWQTSTIFPLYLKGKRQHKKCDRLLVFWHHRKRMDALWWKTAKRSLEAKISDLGALWWNSGAGGRSVLVWATAVPGNLEIWPWALDKGKDTVLRKWDNRTGLRTAFKRTETVLEAFVFN